MKKKRSYRMKNAIEVDSIQLYHDYYDCADGVNIRFF